MRGFIDFQARNKIFIQNFSKKLLKQAVIYRGIKFNLCSHRKAIVHDQNRDDNSVCVCKLGNLRE